MNTAAKQINEPIPRIIDPGCNIIAIHPKYFQTTLPTHKPLKSSTAYGAIMDSTSEARINFNHNLRNVPRDMFEYHVLPRLAKHTIVGLGVLCDHGCVVMLTAEKVYVMHNNKLFLSGTRKKGHLWYLNPQDSKKAPAVNELITSKYEQSTPTPSYLEEPMINSITSVYQSKRLKYAMQFNHAAFNNFSKSTLLTAASKRILPLWPLLTRKNISTYIIETRTTHMGHMQRI